MKNRGRFLTLEGIEGVGKTTNLEFVRERLCRAGKDVVVTREPGGTPLAERIRELLLTKRDDTMPSMTELLLAFAARAAHVEQRIAPALDAGKWVLCDRFTDSTLAYQGGGRGLDKTTIMTLAGWVHGEVWPDLTVLLDAPVATGLARAARRSKPDRFEAERQAFFERVRQEYLAIAEREPDRVALIDASRDLPAVQREIAGAVDALLAAQT